jgi:L-2-hydroxyglutarate oxidase LhgO
VQEQLDTDVAIVGAGVVGCAIARERRSSICV